MQTVCVSRCPHRFWRTLDWCGTFRAVRNFENIKRRLTASTISSAACRNPLNPLRIGILYLSLSQASSIGELKHSSLAQHPCGETQKSLRRSSPSEGPRISTRSRARLSGLSSMRFQGQHSRARTVGCQMTFDHEPGLY
jgi:hypothetical protein